MKRTILDVKLEVQSLKMFWNERQWHQYQDFVEVDTKEGKNFDDTVEWSIEYLLGANDPIAIGTTYLK